MLLRIAGENEVIAIPQPSHAWVSGQLSRAWGGAFAQPEPRAEFCFAAEQHDIGWLAWEEAPTLDRDSGRPQTFMQVPPTTHVDLWRAGVRRAGFYSAYASLLVSLHADTIYQRFFDFDTATPENARAVRAFLDEQHAFQREMSASLSHDPRYAAHATREALDRNRRLIGALDWMSLNLCWGVADEVSVADVPTGAGRGELRLRPAPGGAEQVLVEPWPFCEPRVEVRAEGRRLSGRYDSEDALRHALARAPRVLLTFALAPA